MDPVLTPDPPMPVLLPPRPGSIEAVAAHAANSEVVDPQSNALLITGG